MTNFRFQEDIYIAEFYKYIDETYNKHYARSESKEGLQTFELISKDRLRGLHFALGSILKYGDRALLKNQTRSDLLKIAHYAILSLYCYDKREMEKNIAGPDQQQQFKTSENS